MSVLSICLIPVRGGNGYVYVCMFDTLCVYTCTVVVGAYGLGMSTMKTGEKVAFN